jgi:hypothetical protein
MVVVVGWWCWGGVGGGVVVVGGVWWGGWWWWCGGGGGVVLHVTANCIKIISVVQEHFHGKYMSPATVVNIRTSLTCSMSAHCII